MNTRDIRHRPIFGGVFGTGQYEMATTPCVANGLHAVKHMVIEPRAGLVLSMSLDKREALTTARRLLKAATTLGRHGAQVFTQEPNQTALWADDELPIPEIRQAVTRRRREIFDKSAGRCHYCCEPLKLDGKWHVEHQMPRALGGADDLANLVAACTKCNLEKGDRTAIEYVMQAQSH